MHTGWQVPQSPATESCSCLEARGAHTNRLRSRNPYTRSFNPSTRSFTLSSMIDYSLVHCLFTVLTDVSTTSRPLFIGSLTGHLQRRRTCPDRTLVSCSHRHCPLLPGSFSIHRLADGLVTSRGGLVRVLSTTYSLPIHPTLVCPLLADGQ